MPLIALKMTILIRENLFDCERMGWVSYSDNIKYD